MSNEEKYLILRRLSTFGLMLLLTISCKNNASDKDHQTATTSLPSIKLRCASVSQDKTMVLLETSMASTELMTADHCANISHLQFEFWQIPEDASTALKVVRQDTFHLIYGIKGNQYWTINKGVFLDSIPQQTINYKPFALMDTTGIKFTEGRIISFSSKISN